MESYDNIEEKFIPILDNEIIKPLKKSTEQSIYQTLSKK